MPKKILIERFKNNPILKPNPNIKWMSKNVFNCGVIIDGNKKYKMLFRAAWTKNQLMSNLGLAVSANGKNWRLFRKKPVLRCGFNKYCELGIEDPRIIKWIDGWKYVFATAYSGIGGRIGIWRTKNFLNYEWVGVPFDQEDRDASIIPEPINKWAYIIHRKSPNIWISRTRDLTLKSGWRDSRILSNKNEWYKSEKTGMLPEKIGMAGPPIKTPKGWLVTVHIMHGKGENKFNRLYSISFMVLNLKDPTKIEYMHNSPILKPEKNCETNGSVPMVCFSNAIVDPGGDALYVYYGGADTVVCGGKLYKKDLNMCY